LLKLGDLTTFSPAEYQAEVIELIEHGLKDRAIEIRSQALLCGSALIEPREVFLDMLHPFFNKIVAELPRMGHLPTVCDLLREYSGRFLEPGSASRDQLE